MDNKTIHQFSAGVTILLERIKTNPEDFEAAGKFAQVMEDVYDSMQEGRVMDKAFRLRMLTNEEIAALHDAFMKMERPKFDAWVIKEMLTDRNEYSEPWHDIIKPEYYKKQAMLQKSAKYGISPAMSHEDVRIAMNNAAQNAITLKPLAPLPSYADLTQAKSKAFWSSFFKGLIGR